jgi:hypothetical protein
MRMLSLIRTFPIMAASPELRAGAADLGSSFSLMVAGAGACTSARSAEACATLMRPSVAASLARNSALTARSVRSSRHRFDDIVVKTATIATPLQNRLRISCPDSSKRNRYA